MPKFHKREKTPTILQMENAECGAVVLAIILAYFGRYLPISEVREACGVSRDGSKAINIIKAARQYGLDAHGLNLSLREAKLLPPPFIVFWQFNHFLVVEGFAADKVYINDPATGPRIVNELEFAQGFTGIVLFMNPGAEFKSGGKPEPSIWILLWRYIVGARLIFFYILIAGFFLPVTTIGLAFFAKIFFDNVLTGEQNSWISLFLLGLMVLGPLTFSLTALRRFFLIRFYMKLKISGLSRFFYRLLHLPVNFFLQRAYGDLVDRTEANAQIAHIVAERVTYNLAEIINLLILLCVMFFLSWQIALCNITLGLAGIFSSWALSQRYKDLGGRLLQSIGKLSAIEINGIQIIETLKANAAEDRFFNLWANAHAEKVANEQALALKQSKRQILAVFLWGLNLLATLAIACWLIVEGMLTLGGLSALLILLIYFIRGLILLAAIEDDFNRFKGDLARTDDVRRHPLENILASPQKSLDINQSPASIILEVKDIVFGYSRLEPPVFMGISFQMKKGERIAIVGPSGGGKSSVAKLICGLYAPWQGEIFINGIALPNLSREQLAGYLGLVDQEIYLFSATLRENLSLWNPNIADADMYQALKLACMEEVVRDRGGLDCWVEERGRNFSGGQVQRLELARALIGNPKILILDEATSALDPILEQQIYLNLKECQCTLVIIAHRLSAIRDCENILVIDQGKIVQQGRHESLINAGGLYKELVSLEIQ